MTGRAGRVLHSVTQAVAVQCRRGLPSSERSRRLTHWLAGCWPSAVSSAGLSARVTTHDLSTWRGLLGAGFRAEASQAHVFRKVPAEASGLRSLSCYSLRQAGAEASLDSRAGELDPISHDGSRCVQEGRNGRVILEVTSHAYLCAYVLYPQVHCTL